MTVRWVATAVAGSSIVPILYSVFDGRLPFIPLLMVGFSVLIISLNERRFYLEPLKRLFRNIVRIILAQLLLWALVMGLPAPGSEVARSVLDSRLSGFRHSSRAEFSTMSIILPCANEDTFAVNTIKSILDNSNMDQIAEIILIDDGSTVPLTTFFDRSLVEAAKLKFIRHETHAGLTPSRQAGADMARGDVLFFMDCHCAVSDGWIQPILDHVRENPKRFVVPYTTSMDMANWAPSHRERGTGSRLLWYPALFDLQSHFENNDVMILTGCLLGVSAAWWKELGGYDLSMHGWGGENIETSLRNWLCGGEIVWVDESTVAHMYGDQRPKTMKKYSIPPGSMNLNCYRAVAVWADEFLAKFETFNNPKLLGANEISLSPMKEIKERLQCKHFSYFLDRFHQFYHWAGMLPKEVFQIRETQSGLCIESSGESIALNWCGDVETQKWHLANRDGNKCCSGIALWNSAKCMSQTSGSYLGVATCSYPGLDERQIIRVTAAGMLVTGGGKCVLPKEKSGPRVTLSDCDPALLTQAFRVIDSVDTEGSRTIQFESVGKAHHCLAFIDNQIQLVRCAPHSTRQSFFHSSEGYLRPKITLGVNSCLDKGAGGAEAPVAQTCYTNHIKANQVVKLVHLPAIGNDVSRIEFIGDQCLTLPASALEQTSDARKLQIQVSLRPCPRATEGLNPSMKLTKQIVKDDRFIVMGPDGHCLMVSKNSEIVMRIVQDPRDDCDLWFFDGSLLKNEKSSGRCLDAAAGTLILNTCNVDESKQVWSFDNDRLYNEGQCVSYATAFDESSISLEIRKCKAAAETVRFEKFNTAIPLEYQIYMEHGLEMDWGFPKP